MTEGRRDRGLLARGARSVLETLGLKGHYVRAVVGAQVAAGQVRNRVVGSAQRLAEERALRRCCEALPPVAEDVTALVTTMPGSPHLERCLASLRAQRLRPGRVKVVEGIDPKTKALDHGFAGVETDFVLCVDDDMVFAPDCLQRLLFLISAGPTWAEAALPLDDPILGPWSEVHFYRTRALRQLGSLADGWTDIDVHIDITNRLLAAGWKVAKREWTGGEHHPVYLPHEAFWKFRRVTIKSLDYQRPDMFDRSLEGLCRYWQERRDPVALYGIGGLLVGLEERGQVEPLSYAGREEHPRFLALRRSLEGSSGLGQVGDGLDHAPGGEPVEGSQEPVA